MSGRVITAAYISEPIISLYFVFSEAVSDMEETWGESKLRSIPTSIGVVATRASDSPKRSSICSMYAFCPKDTVCEGRSRVMLTPSNQLIGPKSDISNHLLSCFWIKKLAESEESANTLKSSVAAATIVNFSPSIL